MFGGGIGRALGHLQVFLDGHEHRRRGGKPKPQFTGQRRQPVLGGRIVAVQVQGQGHRDGRLTGRLLIEQLTQLAQVAHHPLELPACVGAGIVLLVVAGDRDLDPARARRDQAVQPTVDVQGARHIRDPAAPVDRLDDLTQLRVQQRLAPVEQMDDGLQARAIAGDLVQDLFKLCQRHQAFGPLELGHIAHRAGRAAQIAGAGHVNGVDVGIALVGRIAQQGLAGGQGRAVQVQVGGQRQRRGQWQAGSPRDGLALMQPALRQRPKAALIERLRQQRQPGQPLRRRAGAGPQAQQGRVGLVQVTGMERAAHHQQHQVHIVRPAPQCGLQTPQGAFMVGRFE